MIRYDHDGDGTISLTELKGLLDLLTSFKRLDKDGSGSLDASELVSLIGSKYSHLRDDECEIVVDIMLEKFDDDHSGCLELHELTRCHSILGDIINDAIEAIHSNGRNANELARIVQRECKYTDLETERVTSAILKIYGVTEEGGTLEYVALTDLLDNIQEYKSRDVNKNGRLEAREISLLLMDTYTFEGDELDYTVNKVFDRFDHNGNRSLELHEYVELVSTGLDKVVVPLIAEEHNRAHAVHDAIIASLGAANYAHHCLILMTDSLTVTLAKAKFLNALKNGVAAARGASAHADLCSKSARERIIGAVQRLQRDQTAAFETYLHLAQITSDAVTMAQRGATEVETEASDAEVAYREAWGKRNSAAKRAAAMAAAAASASYLLSAEAMRTVSSALRGAQQHAAEHAELLHCAQHGSDMAMCACLAAEQSTMIAAIAAQSADHIAQSELLREADEANRARYAAVGAASDAAHSASVAAMEAAAGVADVEVAQSAAMLNARCCALAASTFVSEAELLVSEGVLIARRLDTIGSATGELQSAVSDAGQRDGAAAAAAAVLIARKASTVALALSQQCSDAMLMAGMTPSTFGSAESAAMFAVGVAHTCTSRAMDAVASALVATAAAAQHASMEACRAADAAMATTHSAVRAANDAATSSRNAVDGIVAEIHNVETHAAHREAIAVVVSKLDHSALEYSVSCALLAAQCAGSAAENAAADAEQSASGEAQWRSEALQYAASVDVANAAAHKALSEAISHEDGDPAFALAIAAASAVCVAHKSATSATDDAKDATLQASAAAYEASLTARAAADDAMSVVQLASAHAAVVATGAEEAATQAGETLGIHEQHEALLTKQFKRAARSSISAVLSVASMAAQCAASAAQHAAADAAQCCSEAAWRAQSLHFASTMREASAAAATTLSEAIGHADGDPAFALAIAAASAVTAAHSSASAATNGAKEATLCASAAAFSASLEARAAADSAMSAVQQASAHAAVEATSAEEAATEVAQTLGVQEQHAHLLQKMSREAARSSVEVAFSTATMAVQCASAAAEHAAADAAQRCAEATWRSEALQFTARLLEARAEAAEVLSEAIGSVSGDPAFALAIAATSALAAAHSSAAAATDSAKEATLSAFALAQSASLRARVAADAAMSVVQRAAAQAAAEATGAEEAATQVGETLGIQEQHAQLLEATSRRVERSSIALVLSSASMAAQCASAAAERAAVDADQSSSGEAEWREQSLHFTASVEEANAAAQEALSMALSSADADPAFALAIAASSALTASRSSAASARDDATSATLDASAAAFSAALQARTASDEAMSVALTASAHAAAEAANAADAVAAEVQTLGAQAQHAAVLAATQQQTSRARVDVACATATMVAKCAAIASDQLASGADYSASRAEERAAAAAATALAAAIASKEASTSLASTTRSVGVDDGSDDLDVVAFSAVHIALICAAAAVDSTTAAILAAEGAAYIARAKERAAAEEAEAKKRAAAAVVAAAEAEAEKIAAQEAADRARAHENAMNAATHRIAASATNFACASAMLVAKCAAVFGDKYATDAEQSSGVAMVVNAEAKLASRAHWLTQTLPSVDRMDAANAAAVAVFTAQSAAAFALDVAARATVAAEAMLAAILKVAAEKRAAASRAEIAAFARKVAAAEEESKHAAKRDADAKHGNDAKKEHMFRASQARQLHESGHITAKERAVIEGNAATSTDESKHASQQDTSDDTKQVDEHRAALTPPQLPQRPHAGGGGGGGGAGAGAGMNAGTNSDTRATAALSRPPRTPTPRRGETIQEEFARLEREVEELRRQQAEEDARDRAADAASNALSRKVRELELHQAAEEAREHAHERQSDTTQINVAAQLDAMQKQLSDQDTRYRELQRTVNLRLAVGGGEGFISPIQTSEGESDSTIGHDTWTPEARSARMPRRNLQMNERHGLPQPPRAPQLQPKPPSSAASVTFDVPLVPRGESKPDPGSVSGGSISGSSVSGRHGDASSTRRQQQQQQYYHRSLSPTNSLHSASGGSTNSGVGIGQPAWDHSWADTFVNYMHARDEEMGVEFVREQPDDGHHAFHTASAALDAVLYYSTHAGSGLESEDDSFAHTAAGPRGPPLGGEWDDTRSVGGGSVRSHRGGMASSTRGYYEESANLVDLVAGLLSPQKIAP